MGAEEIARLVPHQGGMCLLDRARSWDATRMLCESLRHRDPGNPLRRDGMLPAICGLEFAFQAMALHGAVTGGARPSVGFVSSLRDVAIGAERLDDIAAPLRIETEMLAADARGFIHRFEVSAEGRGLLSGRATVILPDQPRGTLP